MSRPRDQTQTWGGKNRWEKRGGREKKGWWKEECNKWRGGREKGEDVRRKKGSCGYRGGKRQKMAQRLGRTEMLNWRKWSKPHFRDSDNDFELSLYY